MPSMEERLLKKKQKLKEQSEGGEFFFLKDGVNRFRHLPVVEEQEFSKEVTYFYLNKDLGGFISPITWGDPCGMMDLYNKLSKSKKESDREFAKRMKPRSKSFSPGYRYKDTAGKEPDIQAGVKALMITNTLAGELIDLYLDKDEAGDFTDPKQGYDIKYTKEGKGLDTEYSLRPCKPTRACKDLIGKPINLEKMLKKATPSFEETQELAKRFLNAGDDEDTGKDKKKGKNKDKKKKRRGDM